MTTNGLDTWTRARARLFFTGRSPDVCVNVRAFGFFFLSFFFPFTGIHRNSKRVTSLYLCPEECCLHAGSVSHVPRGRDFFLSFSDAHIRGALILETWREMHPSVFANYTRDLDGCGCELFVEDLIIASFRAGAAFSCDYGLMMAGSRMKMELGAFAPK